MTAKFLRARDFPKPRKVVTADADPAVRSVMLNHLQGQGAHGATIDELIKALSLPREKVVACLNILCRAFRVKASNRRRKNPQGRQSIVYVPLP